MTKSNMSVEDVLSDLVATAFCKGQDWKKGDGSATSLDKDTAKALDQLYQLLESCKPEDDTNCCYRDECTHPEDHAKGFSQGWNAATEQYHSNIRKVI